MEEQLISFETAKLAKEKGFKLQSNPFGYITKFYNHNTKTLLAYGRTGKTDLSKAYYAPTQSLLQKWLREVHNIYVESYHDLTSDGTKIQFYTSWGFLQQKDKNGNENVNGWYDEYNDWKTYEEALEIGLYQALLLI